MNSTAPRTLLPKPGEQITNLLCKTCLIAAQSPQGCSPAWFIGASATPRSHSQVSNSHIEPVCTCVTPSQRLALFKTCLHPPQHHPQAILPFSLLAPRRLHVPGPHIR